MIIWQPVAHASVRCKWHSENLEEPAPHTFFILVSNAADKLLPTIISRAQIVTIPLLKDEEVEQTLIEWYGTDPGRASKIAQLAEGNVNLAIKLIDSEEDNNSQTIRRMDESMCREKVRHLGNIRRRVP
jgi:DNA polymerase-3 subunit delta'